MKDARRPVIVIALLALALRVVLMALRGDYIVFDEGYYLLLARSLRAGHGYTLNGLPHVALSPLQPVIVALLSLTGIPDLWASRLLAAVCGAALVVPVAALAYRWFGRRGAIMAAAVTAVAPPLLTFLPFFPGHGWNLYFGSEPLFLLLGTAALAVAALAFDTGKLWLWWVAGALCDLSFCTRLEGAVLGTALGISLIIGLRVAGKPRRLVTLLVYCAGAVVLVPYLLYLHGALGRWAISGRVQAASSDETPPPAAVSPPVPVPAQGGSDAVQQFVWGGDTRALWQTLYALDGSETQMASQYWGVPKHPVVASAAPTVPRSPLSVSRFASFFRALLIVLPVTLFPWAIGGGALAQRRLDLALWTLPAVATALLPALLAYPEPRALLMIVPVACALAGGAIASSVELVERRVRPGAAKLVWIAALSLLLLPTALDAVNSWRQDTPLQQVATARRVVGEYLGSHLQPADRIVSWHPAIAIWAQRDWRVLPYADMGPIVRYAKAQDARAIVLSRFEPSPIPNPPRAFTTVLIDSSSIPPGPAMHLDPVESTSLIFVGRLASPPTP